MATVGVMRDEDRTSRLRAQGTDRLWYASRGVSERDPAVALFDPAAELVAAATVLRPAASRPGCAPAIAATLGCIDTALEAVSEALQAMGHEGLSATAEHRLINLGDQTVAATRYRHAFEEAAAQLAQARTWIARAREQSAHLGRPSRRDAMHRASSASGRPATDAWRDAPTARTG